MKLGLGLTAELFDDEHLALARQLGCESVVAWVPLPAGDGIWTYDDLSALVKKANRHELELAAVENPHPAHWDKILLGEDGRDEQIEKMQQTIINMGKAGIPCFGYNFSIVGVWGYWQERENKAGRGGSGIKSFDISKVPEQTRPNNQHVWFNTVLEHRSPEGLIPAVDMDEFFERHCYFVSKLLPVAEKAGVKLAIHPEDPPVPQLRGMARPFSSVEYFNKIFELFPSEYLCAEFCQGTFSEMENTDIYEVIKSFAGRGKIGYVHFRNVRGQIPSYDEVFIDDGYVDMYKALKIYYDCGYEGTIIPDHTPVVSSKAPRDTGMAYALGYIRALMQVIEGR